MTRPLESDYTSQVAYTRALEAYCDTLAQPEQEPVAWMCSAFDGEPCEQTYHDDCENPIPLYTAPPKWLDRQKFAELIRADEREACAKFLECIDLGNLPPDLALHYGLLINSLVAGLRARGNT